ncbi:lactococcin 972 family bacteriocin [Streptomyces sp. NPDC087300]|uniref:lactococcin 972 family bacteriocin n=1 Tax=Streptomyces sp. NPDC087300 TaxID=3365780 RepID=UPI00382DEA81
MIKNSLKAAAAAGVIAIAVAAPAVAASTDVSGGRWSYNVGGNYVYSNYFHKKTYHSSSVEGAYWAYSGCTKDGVWSKASAKKAKLTSKAYYNPAC